ncbi:MAG: hypothetical protein KF708_16030 [Pirellulales bacterium]|nr:hypothetical protein [Pirellulales bacterium]
MFQTTNSDNLDMLYIYDLLGDLTSVLDPEYTITSYRFHPQRGWLSEAKILGSDLETYPPATVAVSPISRWEIRSVRW